MNSVNLIGRLTRDVDLKQTDSGKFVMNFTLAVDKPGREDANFISCVVWGEYAGKLSKLLVKGQQIGVEGSLNTRTYEDKNGTKHYITEVYVNHVTFTGKKNTESASDDTVADDVMLADVDILDDEGVPL